MKLNNKFKNLNKIYGGWLSINNFQLCDILSNLKIDFLGVDLEHTPTSIDQFLKFVSICHSKKISCLPRIPDLDNALIKRLLDSGADGIIAPSIENVEQIEFLENSIFYPPNGYRGYGVSKASNYGLAFNKYVKNWNKSAVLIIQIESIKAIKNLESLISKKCVSGVMIGPYDISGSLGIPGELSHPAVLNACKEILLICKKYKKSCGIHDTDPNPKSLKLLDKNGYNFIVIGSDIFLLTKWVNNMNKLLNKK